MNPSAPDPYSRFLSTQRFGGLDALRALSVLIVIWRHVGGDSDLAISRGNLGVDMFFAISGFLITTLLLREYSRTGTISLRDFYARRSLRIFPLYYAVLALYVVLTLVTMRGTPKAAQFWENLPAFLTYTSNWFVSNDGGVTFYFAWSLATEEQFYLFWPALLLITLAGPWWLSIAAALALVGLQLLASPLADSSMLATVFASLAPGILLGAGAAVLLNRRAAFERLFPVIGHRLFAPMVVALLVGIVAARAPALLINVLMVLLVVAVCVREDTALHPVLTWRPLVFLGTISYGVYLMHMIAANVVRKVIHQDMGLGVFVATTALVTLLAWVSFRWFESPILRHAARFRHGKRVATTEIVSPSPAA